MFKFFEGALGDILAPVTGSSHQFFLAIQHYKNDDVQMLLSSDMNLVRVVEGGISALHCACKHNNAYAIDLIMNQGELLCLFFMYM